MNKTTRKVLLSCLTTIGFCASIITSATYALFTSESEVNITVSSGKVDVKASIESIELYSPTLISEKGTIVNGDNAAKGMTFANGGEVSYNNGMMELNNMTPGDKVEFDIAVKNNSNIAINYRTIIGCEYGTGLFEGLTIKINDQEYDGKTRYSDYKNITTTAIDLTHVEIEMPLGASNEYQGKATKLFYQIEAIQGNGELEEHKNDTYYIYSTYDLVNLEYSITHYDNVKLMADIDMDGIKYTPIDFILGRSQIFTFDGNNHTITNFAPTGLSDTGYIQNNALFASVNSGIHGDDTIGTFIIKDLTIDNATITQKKGDLSVAAALIGNAKVADIEINNCKVTNSEITSDAFAAGLIGYGEQQYSYVSQKIINCEVSNCNITGNDNTGGLMALSNFVINVDTATISDNIIDGQQGHSAAAILGAGNLVSTNVTVARNTFIGGGICSADTYDNDYGIYHSFGTYSIN